MSTATATTDCSVVLLPKPEVLRTLHEDSDSLRRSPHSSEKRLARILLLLASFGTAGRPEPVVPKIS